MRQIETTYRTISVAPGAGSRRSSQRGTTQSDFVSQLFAERDRLSAQRAKRRATPLEALRTYDAGGKLRVMRVPPGYRMDILA